MNNRHSLYDRDRVTTLAHNEPTLVRRTYVGSSHAGAFGPVRMGKTGTCIAIFNGDVQARLCTVLRPTP